MDIEVTVPDGVSGDWHVETFAVSESDSILSSIRYGRNYVREGTYKRLRCGSTTVMSNTRMEVRTNLPVIRAARGRVLINGLGLGMILTEILKKPEVTEVWVIEKNSDVIALVGPHFAHDPRVKIINADAFEYNPPKGVRFDVVWHDIWPFISVNNLEEMKKLHRKYGKRCDWQGSWARDMCQDKKKELERNRFRRRFAFA